MALAAALLTALLILVPVSRASAHDELIASDPAVDATVETLPEELSLTFSAALIDAPEGTAVVVTDAAGNTVSDGAAEINGAILTQPLVTDAAVAGEYRVQWQVVSSDGHPTEGEFSFTVATGAAASTAEPTSQPTTEESAAPGAVETTAPAVDDPNNQAQVSISPAWMIGAAVVLLIAIFLAVVLLAKRRRSAPDSDSDSAAEG